MIKLSEVTKIFDSRGIAGLHALSLNVPKGQVFALMGPNGSGKTTLLNVISGKLPIESGEIKVSGSIHFFEKKNPGPDLNVQRFLMESVVDQEIDTDKKLQLSRDMASIFEFTFQLKQNISQLSQGQLQKVLMAAELISLPDIIFLDEPFVHLDPMSRKDILDALFTYLRQRETTVIWITHEKDEALRFSDLVGLMQHGKLEQVSNPVKILKEPRNIFVAQYFGHQNFIKITGNKGLWATPWGDLKTNLLESEAFLVIPPQAWRIVPESEYTGKIIQQFPQYFSWELTVEARGKEIKICLPLSGHDQYLIGDEISLTADLSQCFVIPL